MELVKDIYFNTDKLIENTKVKISYTGKFYQSNNEKVYLHYGYGDNWNNINEIEMSKTDLGYQAEICLTGDSTLNFCFKNQNNEWDNNLGNNYIFQIEKAPVSNINENVEGSSNTVFSFLEKNFNKSNKNQNNSNIFLGKSINENIENNYSKSIPGNSCLNSVDTIIDTTSNGFITDMDISCPIGNKIEPLNTIENNFLDNSLNTISNSTNINETDTEIKPITKILEIPFNTKKGKHAATTNGIFSTNINDKPLTNDSTIKVSIPVNTNISENISDDIAKEGIVTSVTNIPSSSTALVTVNSGVQKTVLWTKKIKDNVCKFFSYIPKLISGNYKRKIDNVENK